MAKVYIGQTAFKITLTLKQSINNVVSVIDITYCTVTLPYLKPDGSTGFWSVTTYVDKINGIVEWEPASASDLNLKGNYRIWAHIVYSDGTEADSTIYEFQVYEPGT